VTARLQADIRRGADGRLRHRTKCGYLSMSFASTLMPTFADDSLLTCDHASNPWIGMSRLDPTLGKRQSAGHRPAIKLGEHSQLRHGTGLDDRAH